MTLKYYESHAPILTKRYESADLTPTHQLLKKNFYCKYKTPKILEIGCGSGRDAYFILNNGFDIKAIDGSKSMIENALKIHPKLANRLFVKTLPSKLDFSEKFDGIYSIATLMHFSEEELETIFKDIYSLLFQNGKFIFSIPIKRDDLDENSIDKVGRFFLIKDKSFWIKFTESIGFKFQSSHINHDSLGRDEVIWESFVFIKKKVD